MALPHAHATVLRRLVGALTAAGVRHGVGGSALLALLGLPVTVRDVDIEIDPRDRAAMAGVTALDSFDLTDPFATHGPIAVTGRGSLGCGRLWRGSLDGVPVEVFEHPGLHTGAGFHRLPLRLQRTVSLGGDEVPLAEPAFWWALYCCVDPVKAGLLEPLVPPHERERASAEIGLRV